MQAFEFLWAGQARPPQRDTAPAGLPRAHLTKAAGRVGREAVEHCCLRWVREAAAPDLRGIIARAAAENPGLQAVAGCCCCLQAVAGCCCCFQAVAEVPGCCRQAEEACQSCQAVVGCPGLQEAGELYCRCQVVVELHHCCQVVVACRKLQMAGGCRGRQAVGQPCCCQAVEACCNRLKVGECRGCRLVGGLCYARLVEACHNQTAVEACRRSLQEAKGAAPLHSHQFAAGTGCAVPVDCASQRLEVVCGRGSSGWVGGWVGGFIWTGENCLLRCEGSWAMRKVGSTNLNWRLCIDLRVAALVAPGGLAACAIAAVAVVLRRLAAVAATPLSQNAPIARR